MTIKEKKIILFFLKKYKTVLEIQNNQELDNLFNDFFSREELIEILEYLYLDGLDEHNINSKENNELLELIGWNVSILEYYITSIEKSITTTPTLSQKEKKKFFEDKSLETHYLYTKPTKEWDSYDVGNYHSLLWKHGKTKRVFAVFTSDVDEKDKYVVSTKPSYFFDTEEEAIAEIENIIKERKFKREELKVMSLWQIT